MATLPKPLAPRGAVITKQKPPKPGPSNVPSRSVRSFPASKAKTHLLELLKDVDTRRESILITRRGRPVAQLVPIDQEQPRSIFGYMKGTIKITGDIVGPEPDIWEAMS